MGMTVEEIIKGLESVKTECGKRLGEGFAWICKPIDEAIEVLKREPCEDCVSRQAVLDVWHTSYSDSREENEEIQYKKIAFELPPVTPQPKTGHWVFKEFDEETGISNSYWCSACNYPMAQVYDDCCAHCGAKMESEGEK